MSSTAQELWVHIHFLHVSRQQFWGTPTLSCTGTVLCASLVGVAALLGAKLVFSLLPLSKYVLSAVALFFGFGLFPTD